MTLCEVAETPLVDYVPSVLRNHIGEILQSSLRNNSNNFPDTNSLQNESVTPSTFCTITPLGTGCASTTEGSAYQSNDEAMMKTRLVQGGSQDGTGSVRRIVVTEDTDNRSTIVAYFDMPAQRSNIHSRISGQMGELAGEENSMMGLSEGQKTTITSLSGYNACNEYCSPDDILLEDARSNARNSEDFSPMSLVLLPSSEIKPCLSINHPDFEQDKSEWIRITFRFGKGQDLEMKMRRSARLRCCVYPVAYRLNLAPDLISSAIHLELQGQRIWLEQSPFDLGMDDDVVINTSLETCVMRDHLF